MIFCSVVMSDTPFAPGGRVARLPTGVTPLRCATLRHTRRFSSCYRQSVRSSLSYFTFKWLYNKGGVNCNWHDESTNLDRHPELAGVLWPYLRGLGIHLCSTFDVVAREMSCQRCRGATIPVKPQYGYTMNSYLNGDAWDSVPAQYQTKIKDIRKETQVKEPANTFYFSEENSWAIPGISAAGINDNNLRSTPAANTDAFATFHRAPGRDKNLGFANAVFVDGHVEQVSAYPAGNTYQLSWPGNKPGPQW